jgi:hypothetical protein
MLMLTGGIFVAVGGAALSGMAGTILAPVIFIAVGAPFIALGLGSGHGQLAYGVSSSTGRLEATIFGACFAIAGLVWGGLAVRNVLSRLRFSGFLASVVGVGVAFVIATGVSSAIGSSPVPPLTRVTQSTAPGAPSPAVPVQASRAIARANAQFRTATKLAACVTAAGSHINRIQVCERKYVP